ncbi:MAG: hypothetical protein HQM08_00550 [Candidatus Riflebacteria bacterium]|nr:hypothetical protein [Candidatus Riflebacteria bacterium]
MTFKYIIGKNGFTIIELLMGTIFLSSALLGIFAVISSANRMTMDAYYEILSSQLANEPIEVFRSFGYEWLKDYSSHQLPDYPLGWNDIADRPFSPIKHPSESTSFQREISLQEFEGTLAGSHGKIQGIKVIIKVSPKSSTNVSRWLSRNYVSAEAIIFDRPK